MRTRLTTSMNDKPMLRGDDTRDNGIANCSRKLKINRNAIRSYTSMRRLDDDDNVEKHVMRAVAANKMSPVRRATKRASLRQADLAVTTSSISDGQPSGIRHHLFTEDALGEQADERARWPTVTTRRREENLHPVTPRRHRTSRP